MSDDLAGFVVARRHELGLTRQELAGRADVSYPYVSQIETRQRVPSLSTLRKIAEALEVPMSELASRVAPDDWTSLPLTSLPPSVGVTSAPPRYDEDDVERYREKLMPSLRRRLREAPPLVQVELLTELMQDAVREARHSGR